MYKLNLKILTSGPRHRLWRVPWAITFYAFQHNKLNKKFTFVSWKWGLFVLKKGNPIFPIKLGQRLPKSFSQLHVKKFKIFSFILFEKRPLSQGIRRPKAADSPLINSTHNHNHNFIFHIKLNIEWRCFALKFLLDVYVLSLL